MADYHQHRYNARRAACGLTREKQSAYVRRKLFPSLFSALQYCSAASLDLPRRETGRSYAPRHSVHVYRSCATNTTDSGPYICAALLLCARRVSRRVISLFFSALLNYVCTYLDSVVSQGDSGTCGLPGDLPA